MRKKRISGDRAIIIKSIGIVLLLAAMLGYIAFRSDPKTVESMDRVWGVLNANWHDPQDTTEEWQTRFSGVTGAVEAEDDTLYFCFLEFADGKTALKASQQFRSYIRWNRYDMVNVEFEENISNYSIYTIRARGLYSALVRVGNTVAFGMSTEENALHVQDILKDLDYWSN